MTLRLTETADGVLLPVLVVPRASRAVIEGVSDGALRIRLAAPPVDGAANEALRRFLAKKLGLKSGDIEIRSGERGRRKLLMLRGVARDVLIEKLGEAAVERPTGGISRDGAGAPR